MSRASFKTNRAKSEAANDARREAAEQAAASTPIPDDHLSQRPLPPTPDEMRRGDVSRH